MKLAVLLGAGAFKPLDLPTTAEFRDLMRDQDFFEDLNTILPFDELYDVEDILSELENFISARYLPHSVYSLLPPSLVIFNGEEDMEPEISQHDVRIRDHVKSWKARAKEIKEEIGHLVHETYDVPDEKVDEATELYRPWLDELLEISEFSELPFFTTNYDGVLREVVRNLGPRYKLVDGFRSEESLDHKVFDQAEYNRGYSGLVIKVFCLHGELDWKLHRSGYVVRKSKGWRLDTSDVARSLIYPVKGGKFPYEEPFKTLHNFLRDKLGVADKALIIGYSFRDLPLNDALNDCLLRNSELEVVVLSPQAESHAEKLRTENWNIKKELLDRFKFINGSFEDEESRERVIESLKGESGEETEITRGREEERRGEAW